MSRKCVISEAVE